MIKTVEAIIDENGNVTLREVIGPQRALSALRTILK